MRSVVSVNHACAAASRTPGTNTARASAAHRRSARSAVEQPDDTQRGQQADQVAGLGQPAEHGDAGQPRGARGGGRGGDRGGAAEEQRQRERTEQDDRRVVAARSGRGSRSRTRARPAWASCSGATRVSPQRQERRHGHAAARRPAGRSMRSARGSSAANTATAQARPRHRAARAARAATRAWYSGCGSSRGAPSASLRATSLWKRKSWKGSGVVKRRVKIHENAAAVVSASSVGTKRRAARPRGALMLGERRA